MIVIKGGIIAIKSSRNQTFTGIISFSAGKYSSNAVFSHFYGLTVNNSGHMLELDTKMRCQFGYRGEIMKNRKWFYVEGVIIQ